MYSMPRRQHSQNDQNDQHSQHSQNDQNDQQQGGMTTSEWGVKTFGDMGQQSAVPGTNLLAIKGGNNFLAGLLGTPPPTDNQNENKNQHNQNNQNNQNTDITGGNLGALMSSEVMTPVLLTVVSNQVAKRLGKTRKTRGGNLTSVAVPAMLVIANNNIHKILGKSKSVKVNHRRARRTLKK